MRWIDLVWAGGEDRFCLDINHLKAIQDRCDAGPAWVLARLRTNQWLVQDVTETIRLSLECGGMPKEDARKKVKVFVEDRPLTESVLTAVAILMHALYGSEEDQEPGEVQAAAETT